MAFIVYLISHNRPMAELLSPNFKDMKPVFEKEFSGMTSVNVKLEELNNVRKTLVRELSRKLTDDERAFLLSFKEKKPKWDLLGVEGAKDMPAVKWKLINLAKMRDDKHTESVDKLLRIL